MNSMIANPAVDRRAPPTSVPMPSRTIEARSSRIGRTRSLYFWATIMPSAPPARPPSPDSTSESVSALPPFTRFFAYRPKVKRPNPQNWYRSIWNADRPRAAGRRAATSRNPAPTLRSTRAISCENVVSRTWTSARWIRMLTNAAAAITPAPITAGTNGGAIPARPPPTMIPMIWKRPPPA